MSALFHRYCPPAFAVVGHSRPARCASHQSLACLNRESLAGRPPPIDMNIGSWEAPIANGIRNVSAFPPLLPASIRRGRTLSPGALRLSPIPCLPQPRESSRSATTDRYEYRVLGGSDCERNTKCQRFSTAIARQHSPWSDTLARRAAPLTNPLPASTARV